MRRYRESAFDAALLAEFSTPCPDCGARLDLRDGRDARLVSYRDESGQSRTRIVGYRDHACLRFRP